MIRRWMVVVLLVVAAVGSVSLADWRQYEYTGPKYNVTINICALNDISTQVALAMLHESNFEEVTGITVRETLLEFAPMVEAQKMDFLAGTGQFDVVAVDQPSLGLYVTSGWIAPLDDFVANPGLPSIDREDLIPALLGPCGVWEESLYAIPMGSYGNLFGYRTDLFEEAGLEAPPNTFEEFKCYARLLNNPPDVYGTVLYAHKGEYLSYDLGTYLWSWGAGFINGVDCSVPNWPKYHVAWDTPQGLGALKFYVSLYREGLVPPDSLVYDHIRFTEAFQVGKVAMGLMIQESVGEPMENPEKSKVVGLIAYAPVPGKINAEGMLIRTPHIGAHSLAINADSRQKEAAYRVLAFLIGREIGQEYILRGGKPFRFSHFFEEAYKVYPYLEAQRENIPSGKCRPNIPEYPAVSEIFSTALHRVLSDPSLDVEEVMIEAARKANEEVLKPAYPEYYK